MSDHNQKDWAKFKEKLEKEELDEQKMEEAMDDDEDEDASEDESSHSTSALEHPDYNELEEKLTLAEQKAHENWEKSVRAMAELDNVRRRAERDVANAHRFGAEKLIKNILPVLDSLEQAYQLATSDNQTAMQEGLQLTMRVFLEALEKEKVSQIDPAGEIFNPQEHEAMSTQVTDEVAPNTVVEVFQKGYMLHDRVIRPARVVVAKAKT